MRKSHLVGERTARAAFALGAYWLLMALIGCYASRCCAEEADAIGQPGTSLPAPGASPGAAAGGGAPSAALASPLRDEAAAAGGAPTTAWLAMPNMIGDFINSGGFFRRAPDFGSVPTATRYKVMDDNNPLPTDRVFFDYQHYAGAVDNVTSPTDLNHFLFGAEKTFFDGMASLEVRLPLDQALSAIQPTPLPTEASGTEFGNIALVPKAVLLREDDWCISGGLGIVLPTARSSVITLGGTTTTIENQSVHLQPFVGWEWQPNARWFTMAFVGFDFDPSGDPVISGGGIAGQLFDQNLFSLDWKWGYWLYQNPSARFLNSVAPTIELHYTTAITDGTTVASGTATYGPEVAGIGRWANLNITGGIHCAMGKSTLTLYGAAPLVSQFVPATGALSSFFSEFGVQVDRRF